MRRSSGVAAAAALAMVLVASAGALAAPTLDDQVYGIAKDLMCPVCAGQTVSESGAQLAVQMREIIRERLQRGESREQIIAYFIGQFGEGVLAAPPRRGAGLLLWLSLPLALGIGFVVLRRFVRRSVAGRGGIAARAAPPPPTPDEVERIERELREIE